MTRLLNPDIEALLERLDSFDKPTLILQWRNHLGGKVPDHLPRWLLARLFAYRLQVSIYGGLDPQIMRLLKRRGRDPGEQRFEVRQARLREGADLSPGTILVREWQDELQHVTVTHDGFAWRGETYGSLSRVARAITGTNWNGHRFFALHKKRAGGRRGQSNTPRSKARGPIGRPQASTGDVPAHCDADPTSITPGGSHAMAQSAFVQTVANEIGVQ
jgi:Protein of unknown function (DUF2924)